MKGKKGSLGKADPNRAMDTAINYLFWGNLLFMVISTFYTSTTLNLVWGFLCLILLGMVRYNLRNSELVGSKIKSYKK